MERRNEIIIAVESFIRGGDNRDVHLLEQIMHEKFQNIQDGFFDEKGIFVMSKREYISLIETKKFGGIPRTINVENIDMSFYISRLSLPLLQKTTSGK